MRNFILLTALILSLSAVGQTNFTYTPEKPKPGDEIKFTYTPSGDLAGTLKIPEAFVIKDLSGKMSIENVELKREYGKLTGKIKTDTSYSFIALSFKDGAVYDNNNNGYVINFYEGDKVKKNSYANTAYFLSFYGPYRLAMKDNSKKVIEYYDEEFKLYPENKEKHYISYLNNLYRYDKEKGTSMIQGEIEKMMKDTLNTKDEFTKVEKLYSILKLRQQSAFIYRLRKEKFALDKSNTEDFWEMVNAESSIDKKEKLLQELNAQINSDAGNKDYKSRREFLVNNLARSFMKEKDWVGFRRMVALIESNASKSGLLNTAAWKIKDDSTNLKLAEELSRQSVQLAKMEWQNPSGTQPNMMTYKEWKDYNKGNYASFADTYAIVLYRMGQYKKALPYTAEATYAINKGQDIESNKTYAVVAEHALSPKKYKPQLEQFVKDGKSTAEIKDVLKRLYSKEKGNDAGFENYIAALEKEAYLKMLADLKKGMMNEATPKFALKDLNGNIVNIADFKGKVVILDFWATWCGPCIASMPGMQKLVNKYKDDLSVKFLFIDTWQKEENKNENAAKFLKEKKYDFHVLMDNEDKVSELYNVGGIGIPYKFIIGKDGNIKFKSSGFDGESKLLTELSAMITLAGNNN